MSVSRRCIVSRSHPPASASACTAAIRGAYASAQSGAEQDHVLSSMAEVRFPHSPCPSPLRFVARNRRPADIPDAIFHDIPTEVSAASTSANHSCFVRGGTRFIVAPGRHSRRPPVGDVTAPLELRQPRHPVTVDDAADRRRAAPPHTGQPRRSRRPRVRRRSRGECLARYGLAPSQAPRRSTQYRRRVEGIIRPAGEARVPCSRDSVQPWRSRL